MESEWNQVKGRKGNNSCFFYWMFGLNLTMEKKKTHKGVKDFVTLLIWMVTF